MKTIILLMYLLLSTTEAEDKMKEAIRSRKNPDWTKVKEIVKSLQSSSDKKDAMELTVKAIELINAIPSTVEHVAIGYTVGDDFSLFLNIAPHLTGKTHTFKINQLRKAQKDCLYLDDYMEGPVILYTGKNETLTTCDPAEYYMANPAKKVPVRSLMNRVTTRTSIYDKSGEAGSFTATQVVMKGRKEPYYVDPAGFNLAEIQEKIIFAGGYVEETTEGMRYFHTRYLQVLDPSGEMQERPLMDEWNNCQKCQGEHPQKAYEDFQ